MDELQKVKEILKRYSQAKNNRTPWESDWQRITDYLLPRRSNWSFSNSENHSQKVIYDDTGVMAVQKFADGIQGNMLNSSISWLGLRMRQKKLMDLPLVKDWLEDCEEVIYEHFNQSSFYHAVNEFLLDFGGPGTATMYIGEDVEYESIYYLTRHPKEIYITQDFRGRVNGLFRRFTLTGLDILDLFEREEIHRDVYDRAKENPDYKHEFIHYVAKRIDRDPLKIDNRNMPYFSVYIDPAHKKLIRESGYRTFPYLVSRVRKNSDEVYARALGMDVFSSVMSLQNIGKSLDKAVQLTVEPPINVPAHLLGKVRITPRGQNVYTEPGLKAEEMRIGANYPYGKDLEQDKRQSIRERFFEDFFLMLNRAERQMTAREVMERQGEKAAILGSIISQLNSEFLNPLIERVFYLLADAGKIPSAPPALLQFPGASIEIDFKGPLAEAARRSRQSSGVLSAIEIIPAMMQWAPETVDNIDTDILTREVLTAQGVPQRIIRETEDVEKIREIRAAQIKRQMQMEQAQQAAEAYPKLARAPEPGSPAEGVA